MNAKALLAHPGTQFSAQLAQQLYRHDALWRFWTCFALPDRGWIERTIHTFMSSPPKWVGHRIIPSVPRDRIRTRTHLEVMALLQLKFGAEPQAVFRRRNERFQRAVSTEDIKHSDVVIGFDTSAHILAERATALDRPLILDQTIAHPMSKRPIYESLRKRFPDWSDDLEVRDQAVSSGETAEQQLASRIAAASSFTKKTLVDNGVNADKIVLNPYGVDLQRFSIKDERPVSRPLRFLFAGLVGARKGVPLLLEAWNALQPLDAELWIAGPLTPVASRLIAESDTIKILGKIPNRELAEVMADSDVFVFPSYFEGFGLVLLEALAAGLPVLTTSATAGPDIVTEGVDGFVIEPGDLAALIDSMKFCLENRDRIAEMKPNCRRTAEKFSWDAYGDRWARLLDEVVA